MGTDSSAGFPVAYEISSGRLVIPPRPSRIHQLDALRIHRQLAAQVDGELTAATTVAVESAAYGILRRPDVLVFPESALHAETEEEDERGMDPAEVVLAVEIVSPSNPENDYIAKSGDYARFGIPDYLIADPRDGTCVHYFAPSNGTYGGRSPHTFGDVITLGGYRVDTGALVRYPAPSQPATSVNSSTVRAEDRPARPGRSQ